MTPLSDALREVIAIFQSRPWPETSPDIDRAALLALTAAGFICRQHAGQAYIGKRGRSLGGWMNLGIERGGIHIGIEIDAESPREKSVRKLRLFNGERLLILRRGKSFRPAQIHGIHRVISIAVERSTKQRTKLAHHDNCA